MKKSKILFFLVVVVASVGGTILVIKKNPKLLGIGEKLNVEEQSEISEIIAEVGKIIELPQGETPTLATVTDIEKVKGQKFFEKAQNGDKVLIYSGAKKAYLYRPSQKKIIEVGVVNLNQDLTPTISFPPAIVTPTSKIPTNTLTPTPTSTYTETPVIGE